MLHRHTARIALLLGLGVSTTACGPRLVPVIEDGQLLPDHTEATIARARAAGDSERARMDEERMVSGAVALATCSPDICDAIARGEVAIGMTLEQVLAATRTTTAAWETRSNGGLITMTPRAGAIAPSDAVGEIAYVGIRNATVTNYTYREPQGFRSVSSPADATFAGRAASQADALLRQGDEFAAAGRLDLALERYDQADVIRPGHAETTIRIASTLDKQLRPVEALMRYQLFIHQMELERIEARGEVAAKIAEAIARARERVVVLEQR